MFCILQIKSEANVILLDVIANNVYKLLFLAKVKVFI
jgi:hypothetical protein